MRHPIDKTARELVPALIARSVDVRINPKSLIRKAYIIAWELEKTSADFDRDKEKFIQNLNQESF